MEIKEQLERKRNCDSYAELKIRHLSHMFPCKKTKATTFWYHKKLKKDVLVYKIIPGDMVVWWDENSHRWAHDKVTDFIFVTKGKH